MSASFRIRSAQFVQVPVWALERITSSTEAPAFPVLVYVGLRLLAWEQPRRVWRSERTLADAIGGRVGVPGASVRRYLPWLRHLGLYELRGELVLHSDDPGTGSVENHPSPPTGSGRGSDRGSVESQFAQPLPITGLEREIEKTPSSTSSTRGGFDEFWDAYPRKVGKPNALKAWTRATRDRKADPAAILEGLARWARYWATREAQFTPHAATWLARDGWLDEVPAGPAKGRPGAAMPVDDGGGARGAHDVSGQW